MSRRERVGVLVLTVGALALLASLPRLARPYPGIMAWPGAVEFSQERAWADVVTLATTFPRRWSGGPDRAAAADWIASSLDGIGLQVTRQTFPVWLGGRQPVALENVWGISRGSERPDEIIVLLGNYDMAPTSYQAASDTAGHVGTILELARVLSAAPHRRTLVFFFPDAEEWGMLGARRFAQTFPQRASIVAALSIEDLDVGDLAALGIDGIGQFRGFAPMWLRALAADAASREGYRTDEVMPLFEWFQRAVLVSFTDQGPLLGAGIPAIDLAGRSDDQVLKDAVYHLPGDTIEKMRPGAVLAYGRIQERIVRAIDALPSVPRESSVYLRIDRDRVVPGGRLLFVQGAVFMPLLVALAVRLRRRVAWDGFRRESLRLGAALGVLLAWLAAVKALPLIGLMPRYTLYPPPPRHPMLTSVAWLPVAVTLLVLGAAAVIGAGLFRSIRRESLRDPRTQGITVALLWLTVIALLALLDNPFGAVTFLLLPALLWIWIGPAAGVSHRALNVVLLALGFAVVVRLFAQYSADLRIGGYIIWYVFMALAYGQFTARRLILTFALIAIAVRLLAHGTLSANP